MRHLGLLLLVTSCGFSARIASIPGDGMTDARLGDATPDSPPDAPLPLTCGNTVQDGTETDVDCGGLCLSCAVGRGCALATDCLASICASGTCRLATQCNELHQALPNLGDASYTIDPDGVGGATSFTTSCDMTVDNGGWTLIGKVDGQYTMFGSWLVAAVNPAQLDTPVIGAGTYACVDAIYLAINASTEIRVSNSSRSAWVKWPLPVGRTATTWWQHTAGQATIATAPQTAVTVTVSSGLTATCFQNTYGVMPWNMHGGAYPYTSYNATGNTAGADHCLSVGTMTAGSNADGFTHNGNGFDAPFDETTWPNPAYNVAPHVAVWLR